MKLTIAEYPELSLLIWNRKGTSTIDEEEAFLIYENQWKYVDKENLTEKESDLIKRLTKTYGNGVMLHA